MCLLAQAQRSDESTRKLEDLSSSLRTRTVTLETALKSREKELEKTSAQLRTADLSLADAAAAAAEFSRQSDLDLATARQRADKAEAVAKGREREVEALTKAVAAGKVAVAEEAALEAQGALSKAEGEGATLRVKLAQVRAQETAQHCVLVIYYCAVRV